MREAKFKTGQIVCTGGVNSKMRENGEFYCFVLSSLYTKYLQCDWDGTFFLFTLIFGVYLFFSKENWIML